MIKIDDKIIGEIRINRSGSAYLVSDTIPKDIYLSKKNTANALHLDKVEITIVEGNGRSIEGQVTKIVKRNRQEFVGTIQKGDKFSFVVPDNKKIHVDFFVPNQYVGDAVDGQKVIVKLNRWDKRDKNPKGKILRVIGESGENETEINSILHEYGLSNEFPTEVLDELNTIDMTISEEEIANRRDLRDRLTFTIDPLTAKDFDDALSIKVLNDREIEVGVHIADVTHYLRPGTALDIEAYTRGTSLYLVDRTIPMLPEKISNELCSLNPNEDKYTFSAVFTLDINGGVVDKWFGKTIIHSDRRFTYEQAQEIIEEDEYLDNYHTAIKTLNNMAKRLRKSRTNHGSISFNKKEVKFLLDEEGKPVDVILKTSKDSNKLVEEFMLLANKEVAKFIKSKKIPSINRAHDSPSEAKLAIINDFATKLGYQTNFNNPETTRQSLNDLLEKCEGQKDGNILSTLIVRSMQKAFYTTNDMGHYGLNFDDYSHFTSPIRRYSDVLVHRVLYRLLNGKNPIKQDKLEGRCKYLSNMERKAKKAERDSIKFKQVEYMSSRIGKVYEGIVSGIIDSGVFVEIIENQCEGFVKMVDISGDKYKADTERFKIVGEISQDKIGLGDKIHVIVDSVNLDFRTMNLKMIRL